MVCLLLVRVNARNEERPTREGEPVWLHFLFWIVLSSSEAGERGVS